MADVAAVFHWRVPDMAGMTLAELLDWRALAMERWNAMHGSGAED